MFIIDNFNLKLFVARRVRYCRLTLGYSQEKLSELANLEPKYINKIENLKYNIKIDTLDKIIEALDMTLEQFFEFKFPTYSEDIKKITNQLEKLPNEKKEEVLNIFSAILKSVTTK